MALIDFRFISGFRLINGDDLNRQVIDKMNAATDGTTPVTIRQTSVDGIVAFAGGGQTNATLLAATINRVATVANAADSVKLPPSYAGAVIYVVNGDAADSMQVFGSGTDTINDVATATGVAQAAGKAATYVCPIAGKWYRVLSA